jgi:predicted GIY-YIG superfamily endonuclease
MKPFWLYILKCSDHSYYIGHTDDLDKRMDLHHEGIPGSYTFSRRPVELVYHCEFESREEALTRELQLKGWSRAKKEALIRGDFDELHRLAKSRPSTSRERTARASLRTNGDK